MQINKKSKPKKEYGSKLFRIIAEISIKFKWLVLLIWIIGSILIIKNLPNLSNHTISNNGDFLPTNSPSQKAISLDKVFGVSNIGPTIPVIIATTNGGSITNSADQSVISNLFNNLKKVQGVTKVVNSGISSDNRAEELVVSASPNPGGDNVSLVTNLRNVISRVNNSTTLEIHLAGTVASTVDSQKGSGKTNSQIQLYSVLFIVILLLLIFRAPLAPLITLVPPVIVVFIAGPIIGLLSKHGLKVSSIAQLLLTVLVLGAGTDYGLFLIFRVREEIRKGLTKNEAIIKALSRVGESITFSAITVIVALLSLLFATFELYSTLGIPLAIGIALMLIAGLTLLPALLSIFGKTVFWPMNLEKRKNRAGLWSSISSKIVKKPVLVLVIGLVIFISLASFISGYKGGFFAGNSTPPSGSDSALGNALLAKYFPTNSSNPTQVLFVFKQSVWGNLAVLTTIYRQLEETKLFRTIEGPLNINGINISPQSLLNIKKQPSSFSKTINSNITRKISLISKLEANFISSNGKTVAYVTSLRAGNPESTAAMNEVPLIRSVISRIAAQNGAVNNGLVGEAPALYDINSISESDLIKIIPIAIVIIGLILAILIRSLVAPIYLILSVGLSYLASLGLSVLLFIDINKVSGLVFILPFLMFIFLLALGEDYNILVMTRIKEEANSKHLKEAVPRALINTGTTVTSAGLVLAGTFAVFALIAGSGSGGSEFQDIGFGLSAGIILDTFFVRTLLVPSIVLLLGKWNWWPSKHGQWIKDS